MTREEMEKQLKHYCANVEGCSKCLCKRDENGQCYTNCSEETLEDNYYRVFGYKKAPEIKDSGARTVFETGAVRDIQEDKGRCDLVPLDVVAMMIVEEGYNRGEEAVLYRIAKFLESGNRIFLIDAIEGICNLQEWTLTECILEVSMLYKQGMEKYGAYNWQKGIPLSSFISSGVRHYLKHIDGQKDERHDRSFVWNMLGAIWTMNHRPKMIDIPFGLLGSQEGEE